MSALTSLPVNIKSGTIELVSETRSKDQVAFKQVEDINKTTHQTSSIMNWLYFFGLIAFIVVFLVALILKNNEVALGLLIILASVYYYANFAKNNIDKVNHQESLKATVEIAKLVYSEKNDQT